MPTTKIKLQCALCGIPDGQVHPFGCTAYYYDYPKCSSATLPAREHNRLSSEAQRRFKAYGHLKGFREHKYKGVDPYSSSACTFCGQGIEKHD